jgi:hypothetical protein
MASIQHEVVVAVDAEKAWAALRAVDQAPTLFAPVLVKGHVDGNVRTVWFANGTVVDELIVDIDDKKRRIAYSVVKGTPMTHHNASMQILDAGPGRCRFVWITDFLPNDFGSSIAPLIEQGAQALKHNLEKV